MITPGFLLLLGITIAGWFIGRPAQNRIQAARAELSSEDIKTFQERYASPSKRAMMPDKFDAIAEASDSIRKTYIILILVLVAALAANVVLGPNLGLPIGGAR